MAAEKVLGLCIRNTKQVTSVWCDTSVYRSCPLILWSSRVQPAPVPKLWSRVSMGL